MTRKKRIFSLIILPTSFVCLVLLGLYIYFSNSSVRVSQPIYEEIYSTTTDLTEEIRKIDYSIYEALYRSGTQKRDISFLSVQPRHENGHVWDFAELLIKCPDVNSAVNLQKIITRDLKALGPEIRVRKEETIGDRIICSIFAKDLYTHKIVLTFGSYRASVKNVRPKIAIIIDDLGYDLDMAFSFIQLDLPLSFSILPSAPFTDLIVQKINKRGSEFILHLPMEPKNYPSVNPGSGAIFLSMDEHEIRQILDNDLRKLPGAKGVSNHMGSSFTENRDKMLVVLEALKEKGLFYIDSRTTSGTVGFKLARDMGLPTARRSVFLDNDLAHKMIKIQMERLLSMARHSGAAIGIGHPHEETLEIIEEYGSKIKNEFQFVHVSELVS